MSKQNYSTETSTLCITSNIYCSESYTSMDASIFNIWYQPQALCAAQCCQNSDNLAELWLLGKNSKCNDTVKIKMFSSITNWLKFTFSTILKMGQERDIVVYLWKDFKSLTPLIRKSRSGEILPCMKVS